MVAALQYDMCAFANSKQTESIQVFIFIGCGHCPGEIVLEARSRKVGAIYWFHA